LEEWRPIPGFEGYEVSNQGRVRSWRVWGHVNSDPPTEPRNLKLQVDEAGYVTVNLWGTEATHPRKVHRLVYSAFKGSLVAGLVVRHLDGDPSNNTPENLSLGTTKENKADSIRHGTHAKGERHGRAKLSESQVREIRALYAAGGITQKAIGRRFGIGQAQVSEIVRRTVWAHID
jgi:hypothetical protein